MHNWQQAQRTTRVLPNAFSSRVFLAIGIIYFQVFFLSMLVLPTTFQFQRGAALGLLVVFSAVLALKSWRVHREVLLLWGGTMAVGAFGIFWGVINDASGALRVSTVYMIWPTVYLLFIGLLHGFQIIERIENALLLGITLASAMAITVLGAGILGFGHVVFPFFAFQGAAFGHYDGFTEIRTFNLTTVMYGFPFVFSFLMVRRRELTPAKTMGLLVLLAALVVIAVGSGRRMFLLLVLITPFLSFFFLQFSSLHLRALSMLGIMVKMSVVAAVAGVGVILMFDLRIGAIFEQFLAAFLGKELSSGIRFEQGAALLNAVSGSPWVGNGLGSSIELTRSINQPWSYELWYLALLMNVGILGFTVYVIAVGWVILRGMELARRDRQFAGKFVPLMTAMAGFLIMTATNPYLGKFDYLWVIFLPVAMINAYLTRSDRRA